MKHNRMATLSLPPLVTIVGEQTKNFQEFLCLENANKPYLEQAMRIH